MSEAFRQINKQRRNNDCYSGKGKCVSERKIAIWRKLFKAFQRNKGKAKEEKAVRSIGSYGVKTIRFIQVKKILQSPNNFASFCFFHLSDLHVQGEASAERKKLKIGMGLDFQFLVSMAGLSGCRVLRQGLVAETSKEQSWPFLLSSWNSDLIDHLSSQ